MFINFWYPIAASDEVTNKEPHRAEVLGLKLITYRDTEGNAHVLADTCTHQGNLYRHFYNLPDHHKH